MSSERRFLRAAVLGIPALVACSLTTIPDLTSGNTTAGAPGDGGTSNAGNADASAGGGSDSGALGDGGAPPGAGFCASQSPAPSFCDDFDTLDLTAAWTTVHAFDGAFGVIVDTQQARSLPKSLFSRVGTNVTDCTSATVQKVVPGAFSAAHLGFAIRIGAAGDLPGGSIVALLSLGTGAQLCQAYISATGTDFAVGEQVTHPSAPLDDRTYPIRPIWTPGTWTRVDVDYDTAANELVVSVDGTSRVDTTLTFGCPYGPGDAAANIGLVCQPTSTTNVQVWHDDVTFSPR